MTSTVRISDCPLGQGEEAQTLKMVRMRYLRDHETAQLILRCLSEPKGPEFQAKLVLFGSSGPLCEAAPFPSNQTTITSGRHGRTVPLFQLMRVA